MWVCGCMRLLSLQELNRMCFMKQSVLKIILFLVYSQITGRQTESVKQKLTIKGDNVLEETVGLPYLKK